MADGVNTSAGVLLLMSHIELESSVSRGLMNAIAAVGFLSVLPLILCVFTFEICYQLVTSPLDASFRQFIFTVKTAYLKGIYLIDGSLTWFPKATFSAI